MQEGAIWCQVKIPISCDKAMTTDSCLRCLALHTTLHRFPNFRSVFLSCGAFAKNTFTWNTLEHAETVAFFLVWLLFFQVFLYWFWYVSYHFFFWVALQREYPWMRMGPSWSIDSCQLQVIPLEVWCVRALELVLKLWCVHGAWNLLHEKSRGICRSYVFEFASVLKVTKAKLS